MTACSSSVKTIDSSFTRMRLKVHSLWFWIFEGSLQASIAHPLVAE
jgi:hypothetical protein